MSSGVTPSTRSAASSTKPAAKMSRPCRSRSLPAATAGGGSSPNHSTTSSRATAGVGSTPGNTKARRPPPHRRPAGSNHTSLRPRHGFPASSTRAASSIRLGDGETMARRAGPTPDRAGTVVGAPPKSVPTVVSWAARSSASRPCSSSASNRNDEGASGADADACPIAPWCSGQAWHRPGAPRRRRAR